jgi:hypothetical protein
MSDAVYAGKKGFSLIEMLFLFAIVAILLAIIIPAYGSARFRADQSASASNIRQLALANHLYAAAHGHYAAWGNFENNIRWHSVRTARGFDGAGGYLSPFLGEDMRVRRCPVLDRWNISPEGAPFDRGAGGYGYNATYIGGRPMELGSTVAPGATRDGYQPWWAKGNLLAQVANPSEVVMFTSTAIARGGGIVETDQAVPYRAVNPGGLGEQLTPTVHFRFKGKALVAWGDARVSFELPNPEIANNWNIYGDNNKKFQLGWFGPTEWNGYWNPRSADELPY